MAYSRKHPPFSRAGGRLAGSFIRATVASSQVHKAGVQISFLGHSGLERYRIRDSKLARWSIRIGETVTPVILNL